ncbi:GNAT family N-acetyltransferase [Neoroseomonas oryzicola]|uniref:GNAT family N-acetyltransferase n=1 Tax=Neoroseomonas oryzicola TaxID=535904 RepID=A0A9X9WPW1_9PROT|nr:GNAT family N-acetyltransferase [Neoroseomonas oryzicola]MBR0662371.1 GNAT family N-acetyltransferase [Neoroseomonas oryzicola]NKE16120.1 GNAT family N-acetyltransferase [Neoroseomonas oryzicola]
MIIETARLRLRPFVEADIPAYAAIRADPEVMRHMPGGMARATVADADAARLVPDFAADWPRFGYGPWAVEDRATGVLLGHGGLRALPDHGNETEILYMLARAAWGRGLASEIAAAARDLAFGSLGLASVVGYAAPANFASRRVLEKTGLAFVGEVVIFGIVTRRYVLDRA